MESCFGGKLLWESWSGGAVLSRSCCGAAAVEAAAVREAAVGKNCCGKKVLWESNSDGWLALRMESVLVMLKSMLKKIVKNISLGS